MLCGLQSLGAPGSAPGVGLLAGLVLALLGGCALFAAPHEPPAATRTIPDASELDHDEALYGTEPGPPEVRQRQAQRAARMRAPDRPATPREMEAIKRLMWQTQSLRGLPFLRPFKVRVQSRERMREYMREVGRRYLFRMRRNRRSLVALGLVEPSMTVEDLIEETAKVDLEGYYDPPTETLVLRNEVAMSLVHAAGARESIGFRSVVMHELVHVLQDQHFDLERALARRQTSDADQALFALVEGDATLAMMRYQVGRAGADFNAMLRDEELFNELFSMLPPVHGVAAMDGTLFSQPLLFRYQAGAVFSAALVRQRGVRGLAAAFRKPPKSTHAIYDYGAYLGGWGAPSFNRVPGAVLARRGYEIIGQDVLGQVNLSMYLRSRGAGGDMIASGWQADRVLVFRKGGRLGSIWVVAMNTERGAKAVADRGKVAVGEEDEHTVPFASGHIRDYAYLIYNPAKRDLAAIEHAIRDWLARGNAVRQPRNWQ